MSDDFWRNIDIHEMMDRAHFAEIREQRRTGKRMRSALGCGSSRAAD